MIPMYPTVIPAYPAPPPTSTYAEYEVFKNRACRSKNSDGSLDPGSANVAFVLYEGANGKDLTQCQQQCTQTPRCTGVEHNPNTQRCEVWIVPILATADVAGFNCYAVNSNAPAPTPVPGPVGRFAEPLIDRACRSKNSDGFLNPGSANVTFVLYEGANGKDLSECQQQCTQTPGCTGVEHNPTTTRCEVWIVPILVTADVSGFNCYAVEATPAFAETFMGRACRSKNYDGFLDPGSVNVAYLLYEGANRKDLTQCQQQCTQTPGCKGVEHNPTTQRCEVWIVPILATADVAGYNCYTKVALSDPQTGAAVVLVVGSSVAKGVGATRTYGWAAMLGDALRSEYGSLYVNEAVSGYNTRATAAPLPGLLEKHRPSAVVIGLSLANEGLTSMRTASQAAVLAAGYEARLLGIAATAVAYDGVKLVVLGGLYPNNNYSAEQYSELLASNARLDVSGYPMIDFLAITDDGRGAWRAGTYADAGHPNDAGHAAMFSAVDLELFSGLV
ncbi:hypothetical protein FOA52_005414 [Chlamydomonas sp. UWO 241]|nr:hypothetical protein FOA52_005414 [Chlamydomonas sp. UWO 241]